MAAGLFIFSMATSMWKTWLHRARGGHYATLKVGAKRRRNVGTAAQILGRLQIEVSAALPGGQRQNLALSSSTTFTMRATGTGPVLLTYADDTLDGADQPRLGTLLLMNFSKSEFSSNLARQRIFLPDGSCEESASDEPTPASSIVGETVTGEVWKADLKENVFLRPSGEPQSMKSEALLASALRFRLCPMNSQPLHAAPGMKLLSAFAVNASPEESDLRD
jgi:hypothetical protein